MAIPPAVTKRSAPPSSCSTVIQISIRSPHIALPDQHENQNGRPENPLRPSKISRARVRWPLLAGPPPKIDVRERVHGQPIEPKGSGRKRRFNRERAKPARR